MAITAGQAGMMGQAMQIGYDMTAAFQQARAQKALMKYKAKIAKNNAQIMEYQAQQEGEIGAAREQVSRLNTAQMFSAQRAAMAANGIDLGEGVATDVLASTKFMGERDALTIRDNAARNMWAIRLKKQGYLDDAAFETANANSISPFGSALGSLMGNAGTVASMYKTYQAGKTPTGAGD